MNHVNGQPIAGLVIKGARDSQVESLLDQFVQRFKTTHGIDSLRIEREKIKVTMIVAMGKTDQKSIDLKNLATTLAELSNLLEIFPVYI